MVIDQGCKLMIRVTMIRIYMVVGHNKTVI